MTMFYTIVCFTLGRRLSKMMPAAGCRRCFSSPRPNVALAGVQGLCAVVFVYSCAIIKSDKKCSPASYLLYK